MLKNREGLKRFGIDIEFQRIVDRDSPLPKFFKLIYISKKYRVSLLI